MMSLEVAQQLGYVMLVTEDSGAYKEIELPCVNTKQLYKIAEFAEHYFIEPYDDIPKPLSTSNLRELVPEWYVDFVDVKIEEVYDMILAANAIDFRAMLELTSAKIASLMKGKSIEEIRELFNIKDDFSPEDEQQISEENSWAEEAI